MEEQEEMKSLEELKVERELKWKDYADKFWVEDDGRMLDVDMVVEGISDLSWEVRKRFISSLEYVQKWVNESPDITEGNEFFDYDFEESVSCMPVSGKNSCRKNRRSKNYHTEDSDGPARNTRARKRLFATSESKDPIPVQREKSESGSSQFDEKSEIDNALFVAESDPADCVAENINNDPVQIGVQKAETEVLPKDSESLLSDNAKANSILDTIESMFPVSKASPSDALKADDTSVSDDESGSSVLSSAIDFIKPSTKLNRCTEVNVDCTNSEEKNESKSNEVLQDYSNSPRVEHLQEVSSKTLLVEGENLLTDMQDSVEKEPAALHTEPQAVQSHESPANSLHSKCCDSGFHDNSHDEAVCAKSSEKLKVQDGDKKGDSQICNSRMQPAGFKTPERDGDAEQLITTVVKSLPYNNLEGEASKSTKKCLSNAFPRSKEQLSNVALSPQIQMTSKRDSTRRVELIRSEFSTEKIARCCGSTASDCTSSGTERSSLKNESMKKNNSWRENNLIEEQVATKSNLLPSTNTSEHQSDNSLQFPQKFQTLSEAHGDKLAEIKSLEKSHTDISKLCLPEDLSGAEENISNSSSDSNDSSSDISVVDITADDSDRLTKASSARGKRLTYSRMEESDPFLEQAMNALSRKAAKNVKQRCERNGSMLEDKNDEIIKEISLPEDILEKSEGLCNNDNSDVSVSYSKRLLRISSLINQEINSSSTRNKMKRDKFQSFSVDSRNRPKNVSCYFKEPKCVSEISQFGDKRKSQIVSRKKYSNDLRSTHLNESIKSSVYSTSKNGVKESLVNTISDQKNNRFHITPKTANAKYSSDVINDVDDHLHATSSKVEDQSRIIGVIQKMNDCSVAPLSTPSNKRTESNLCKDLGKKIDTNSEDVLAKDNDSSSECPTGIQQLNNMNDESSKVDVGVKHSLLETIMSKEKGKTSHIVGDSKSRSSEMGNISPCQSEGKTLYFPKLKVHTRCLEMTSSFPEDAKKKNCTVNRTISQNEIIKKGHFDDIFHHPLSHNSTFPGTAFCSKNKIIPKANDWSDDFPSKWFGKSDLGKENHAASRNLQPEDESSTEISNLTKAQDMKEIINRLHKRLARRKPSQYVSESELRTADNCLEESFPAGNKFQSTTRISTAKSLREKDVKSNNQPGTDHESEEHRGLNSNVKKVRLVEKFKNVDISSEDSPEVRTDLPQNVQIEGRSFSCSLEKLAKRSTSNKRDKSRTDSGHVSVVGNDALCKLQPAKGAELGHEKELCSTVKQVSITESFKTVNESSRRDSTVRLELPTNVLEKECAQDQRSFAAHMLEKPSVLKPYDCHQKLHEGSHTHRRRRDKPKVPILGIDIFSMCDDLYTNKTIGNSSAWRSQTSLDTPRKKRGIFVPSQDVLESELLEESSPAGNKFQSITRISSAKSLREKDTKSNNQPGTDPESEEDRGLNSNVELVRLAEKFKDVNNSSEDSARVRAKFESVQVEGRSFSCILGNLAERSTSNKRDISQHDSDHVNSVENDMLCKIQPAKVSELGYKKELDSTVKQVSISEHSKTVDESFRRNPAERLEFSKNVLEKECAQDQRSFAAHMIEKPSVVKPNFYQKLDKGSRSHRRKRRKPKIPLLGIDIFSMCDDVDTSHGSSSAQRSQTSLGSSGRKREMFVIERNSKTELGTGYGYLGENAQLKRRYGMPVECVESKKKKVHHADEPQTREPSDENDRSLGVFFRNGTRNSSFVNFNRHSYNEGVVNHKKVSRFGSDTGFLSPEANSSDISSSKWSGKYLDRPLSPDFSRKYITAWRKLPARNSIKDLTEVQNLKQFENGSSNKVAGITPSKYVPELEKLPIDDTAQSTTVSTLKSIRERNSALNNHKKEADSNLLKKGVKCNKQLIADHKLKQVNSSGSRIQVSSPEKFQKVDVSLTKIHAVKAKSSENVLEKESDKEQERFTSRITEKLNLERQSSSYQKQKENLCSHAKSRVTHKIPFLDSDTSDEEEPWADQSVPSVSRICTSDVMLGKGGGGGGGEAEEEAAAFVVESTIKQNRNSEHFSERNKNRKRDIGGKSCVYKKKKPSVSDGSSADHNSDKLNSHLFNGDKRCSEVIINCGDNDRTVDCSENVPETEQEGSSSAAFQETKHCDLSFTVVHEVLLKRPRKVRLKPYKRVVYL